jgi:hypothetical protein
MVGRQAGQSERSDIVMTSTHSTDNGQILSDFDYAHRQVVTALDEPHVDSLVAVTWASAHLAAVERVLYPVLARTLPDGRERIHAQVDIDHRLQNVLWLLDRLLTGDVHLRGASAQGLEDDLRRGLREHAEGERSLLASLQKVHGPEQQRELSERLNSALLRGPTRPHPHTPHGRLIGGLPFWFGGVVDRVRDTMDSRSVPTPHRTPVPRPMTRWGAYALGSPSRAAGEPAASPALPFDGHQDDVSQALRTR